jgi:hypothetical protein
LYSTWHLVHMSQAPSITTGTGSPNHNANSVPSPSSCLPPFGQTPSSELPVAFRKRAAHLVHLNQGTQVPPTTPVVA